MAETDRKYVLRLPAAMMLSVQIAAQYHGWPLSVWIREAIREKLEREA